MESLRNYFPNQWEIPYEILEGPLSKSIGNWLGKFLSNLMGSCLEMSGQISHMEILRNSFRNQSAICSESSCATLKETLSESLGNWSGDLWANFHMETLTNFFQIQSEMCFWNFHMRSLRNPLQDWEVGLGSFETIPIWNP